MAKEYELRSNGAFEANQQPQKAPVGKIIMSEEQTEE